MVRGDIPIEPGYSWFTTKTILVVLFIFYTIGSTERSTGIKTRILILVYVQIILIS